MLAASAMAAAFMVSYTRAKAESLGFASGTGLGERRPRAARGPHRHPRDRPRRDQRLDAFPAECACAVDPVTGVGSCAFALFANPVGSTALAGTLGLITILATLTTIQRILHVRAQSREG